MPLTWPGHIAYVYSTMLACTQVLATGPATRDGKTASTSMACRCRVVDNGPRA